MAWHVTADESNRISLMTVLIAGLVKELDIHLYDYATKHLNTHSTYVLIEKQVLANDDVDHHDGGGPDGSSPTPPNVTYVPLLDNYAQVFPDYRVHVVSKVEKKKRRAFSKSPSPAGVRGIKGAKVKVSKAGSKKAPK